MASRKDRRRAGAKRVQASSSPISIKFSNIFFMVLVLALGTVILLLNGLPAVARLVVSLVLLVVGGFVTVVMVRNYRK